MNEREARNRDYQFTGIYSRWKDEAIEARMAEIKKDGCKAVWVKSDSGGYSIYADERYFANETLKNFDKEMQGIVNTKQWLLDKYQEELKKVQEREERLIQRKEECEEIMAKKKK